MYRYYTPSLAIAFCGKFSNGLFVYEKYYCSGVEPVCCVLRLLYIMEDKLDTKDHFDTLICYENVTKMKSEK